MSFDTTTQPSYEHEVLFLAKHVYIGCRYHGLGRSRSKGVASTPWKGEVLDKEKTSSPDRRQPRR